MADSYDLAATLTTLVGTATENTKSLDADASATEHFWMELSVANGASDSSVTLGGLTDPKILVVMSASTGVSFKLGAAGTDAVTADPFAVVGAETDGLGISSILVSNSGSTQIVFIYAAE